MWLGALTVTTLPAVASAVSGSPGRASPLSPVGGTGDQLGLSPPFPSTQVALELQEISRGAHLHHTGVTQVTPPHGAERKGGSDRAALSRGPSLTSWAEAPASVTGKGGEAREECREACVERASRATISPQAPNPLPLPQFSQPAGFPNAPGSTAQGCFLPTFLPHNQITITLSMKCCKHREK